MDLTLKYRPSKFDDVIGQDSTVASLRSAIKKGVGHAFLFCGPSGTGKTTLSRIVARTLGTLDKNTLEIDAATNSGIDAMRDVMNGLRYTGMGNPRKFVIVDEAHGLSAQAWDSLLKIVEEPPKHLFWSFCTTNPSKVPDTIKQRCLSYTLNAVDAETLFAFLKRVAKAEDLGGVPEDVLYFCAEGAMGSPRRALKRLTAVLHCTDVKEAATTLREVTAEHAEIVDFCRALGAGATRGTLVGIVGKMGKTNPESVRQVVLTWFTKVALGAQTDKQFMRTLNILSAFGDPYPPSNTCYPVLLSLGRVLYDAE